jgi:hypothetical protein
MGVYNIEVTIHLNDQISAGLRAIGEQLKGLDAMAQALQGHLNKGFVGLNAGARAGVAAAQEHTRAIEGTARAQQLLLANMTRTREETGRMSREVRDFLGMADRMRGGGAGGGGGAGRGGGGGGGRGGAGFFGGFGDFGHALRFMGAYEGAHLAFEGVKHSFSSAGDLDREMRLLQSRGWNPAQQQQMIDAARRASGNVQQVSQAKALHGLGELVYASGHLDFGLRNLEGVLKANEVIKAQLGGEAGARHLDQMMELVKSGELKGFIQDQSKFSQWLDTSTQVALSTGGLVPPSKMFSAFKYARSALAGYDPAFIKSYLPELVQEMSTGKGAGGQGGAGNALEAFKSTVVDRVMKAQMAKNWIDAGLADPTKAIRDSRGDIKGLSRGAIYGTDLATRNPKDWADNYLIPALKQQGVDFNDPNYMAGVVQHVGDLFGTRTAKQIAQILVQQSEQMKARAGFTNQAQGVADSYDNLMQTYDERLGAVKAQFDNMSAALAMPGLPNVNATLGGVAQFEHGLSEAANAMRVHGIDLNTIAGIRSAAAAIGDETSDLAKALDEIKEAIGAVNHKTKSGWGSTWDTIRDTFEHPSLFGTPDENPPGVTDAFGKPVSVGGGAYGYIPSPAVGTHQPITEGAAADALAKMEKSGAFQSIAQPTVIPTPDPRRANVPDFGAGFGGGAAPPTITPEVKMPDIGADIQSKLNSLTPIITPQANTGGLVGQIQGAISGISGTINNLTANTSNLISQIQGALSGHSFSVNVTGNVNVNGPTGGGSAPAAAPAPKKAAGGFIYKSGIAYLHSGETVVPAGATSQFIAPHGNSRPIDVTVKSVLDGRVVAQSVTRHQVDAMRMATRGSAYHDASWHGPTPVDTTGAPMVT